MNYLCNCNLCRCAGESADRAAISAQDGVHQTPTPTPPSAGPGYPSRCTGRAPRRRAAACQQAEEPPEPPVGAHLITPRRGYTHHGIYAGQGRVLHYAGLARNFRRGPVEEVSLENFASGRPVHIECCDTSALAAADIVKRARSRLGESQYRLLTNNCEHFAEWSRFGSDRSHQVERGLGCVLMMTHVLVTSIGRRMARSRPNDRTSAVA